MWLGSLRLRAPMFCALRVTSCQHAARRTWLSTCCCIDRSPKTPMWTLCVLFVQLTGIKVKAVPHATKAYGGAQVLFHPFLTSVIHGHEWPSACPSRFTPGNNPDTHWIGGWLDPSASLDVLEDGEIFSPARIRTVDRPTHTYVLEERQTLTLSLLETRCLLVRLRNGQVHDQELLTIASRITGFNPYSIMVTIRTTCCTIQKLHSAHTVSLYVSYDYHKQRLFLCTVLTCCQLVTFMSSKVVTAVLWIILSSGVCLSLNQGRRLLINVSKFITGYMAPHPRTQYYAGYVNQKLRLVGMCCGVVQF
jgi:hypothetical protein